MDGRSRALELLPQKWRRELVSLPEETEELRLRLDRRPTLLLSGMERPFSSAPVGEDDLQCVLEKATGASLHTAAQALAEGYWSVGGVRIGVCGTCMMRDGAVTGFRTISSLTVRIPRERIGLCEGAARELMRENFCGALILGRPGEGKTTALRDLIRCLSTRGKRVAVLDERNELSGTENGKAQFDLGPGSDVLIGVPKSQGIVMLLRSMNPQYLAVDEITGEEDPEALESVLGSGVGLLASAHGTDPQELGRRKGIRKLLEQGMFSHGLLVRQSGSMRTLELVRISG